MMCQKTCKVWLSKKMEAEKEIYSIEQLLKKYIQK